MVRIGAIILAAFLVGEMSADELKPLSRVELRGAIVGPADLSGVTLHAGMLAVCSDEAAHVQLLKRDQRRTATSFTLAETISLRDDDAEIDLEGLASDGQFIFAVGSHSRVRKAVDLDKSRKKNIERLLQIDAPDSRDSLFRLRIDADGSEAEAIESLSLREFIENDQLLGPFAEIPSKENGVDIEGIAADGQRVILGFRAPVLRGNYVPILVLDFDDPDAAEVRFVDLDGLGVRDLCVVEGGFLILAGPVGDAPERYAIYFWDGSDRIPNRGQISGTCKRLARIHGLDDGKPEGLAVLAEAKNAWELLIVHDGPVGGAPAIYQLQR